MTQGSRTRTLTVLVVRADGRSTWQLRLPRWTPAGLRSFALFGLYLAAFLGWQMQALFGVYGPRVELAMMQVDGERWGAFQMLAPEGDGPSRSELRRHASRARALRLGLGDRRAASLLLTGMPEAAWVQDAERMSRGDGTLLWPVPGGMYGRGYGSGSAGYHLALDIDGQRGSEVLASAAGTVGYAGTELRGYGKVVLVVHAGGWITLYGHNQRLLVVAGEHVQQGQALAELGSTGRSMGPHVHYELIRNGRNCDPLPLLRFDPANKPDRLPETALAQWRPEETRPANVRCARRREHPHPKSDPEFGPDDDDFSLGPVALAP